MSQRLPFNSLQNAIYTRLTDAGAGIDTDVYDQVPETVSPPYCEIGEISVSLEIEKISEAMAMIHVFSMDAGNKEANDIMENIIESLTSSALSLDESFSQAQCRIDAADIFKEYHADGLLNRHGTLRFRFIINDDA